MIGDGTLEEAQAAARDTVPAARLGAPEEIAAAAAFLCSAPASYITGTTCWSTAGSPAASERSTPRGSNPRYQRERLAC